MSKTMDFTDESIREMVLGAEDRDGQIANIAELTGLSEKEIKDIAYIEPASEPEPHRHGKYDWGKLDPKIVGMIRSGSTVEEIAEKLGIRFKSAARRCTALRKEIRSGEADAASKPASPKKTPVPDPPEEAPPYQITAEPLMTGAEDDFITQLATMMSVVSWTRISVHIATDCCGIEINKVRNI